MTLPCEDDTLPIFLSYILYRTRDARLKIADTGTKLNEKSIIFFVQWDRNLSSNSVRSTADRTDREMILYG